MDRRDDLLSALQPLKARTEFLRRLVVTLFDVKSTTKLIQRHIKCTLDETAFGYHHRDNPVEELISSDVASRNTKGIERAIYRKNTLGVSKEIQSPVRRDGLTGYNSADVPVRLEEKALFA